MVLEIVPKVPDNICFPGTDSSIVEARMFVSALALFARGGLEVQDKPCGHYGVDPEWNRSVGRRSSSVHPVPGGSAQYGIPWYINSIYVKPKYHMGIYIYIYIMD